MPRVATDTDRKMIADPYEWPLWPLLPVKRYVEGQNRPECGTMIAVEGHLMNVFKVSIFEAKQDVESMDKYEYDSPEAIIADGWVVD